MPVDQRTTWAKVSLRFDAHHRWDDAFEEVEFLQNEHRHEFHVTVQVQQFHDDRDVEYIHLKRQLTSWIKDDYIPDDRDLGQRSCEMMAEDILKKLMLWHGSDRAYKVEVTEDGENGALVEVPADG